METYTVSSGTSNEPCGCTKLWQRVLGETASRPSPLARCGSDEPGRLMAHATQVPWTTALNAHRDCSPLTGSTATHGSQPRPVDHGVDQDLRKQVYVNRAAAASIGFVATRMGATSTSGASSDRRSGRRTTGRRRRGEHSRCAVVLGRGFKGWFYGLRRWLKTIHNTEGLIQGDR